MVMKKAFLVLAILVGSAALTFAQPKSIGGRLGNYGIDVSYENYVFGGADFLEFGLGLDNGFSTSSFHVDGIYNFMILEPDWTPVGHWGFYAGPAPVSLSGRTVTMRTRSMPDFLAMSDWNTLSIFRFSCRLISVRG